MYRRFFGANRMLDAVSSSRWYGNAPSRVRPVEVKREYAWRQSPNEVSAMLVVAMMLGIPLWLVMASNQQRAAEQEAFLETAKAGCGSGWDVTK